jgi:ATP/maltotriose-dependent transcriptional regulator MalT
MLARGAVLLERARALGDGPREMLISARLIGAAGTSGRNELADDYLRKAEELSALLGLRLPFWARAGRCAVHAVRGDLAAAADCMQGLRDDAVAERDVNLELTALRTRGENLMELGRIDEAKPILDEARALSIRMNELWSRTELTASVALVAALQGDRERADRLIGEARTLARPADLFAGAYVAYASARIHETLGRPAEAEADYHRALDAMSRTEFTVPKAWIQLRYVEFLLKSGRPVYARRELQQVEPFFGDTIGAVGMRMAAARSAVAPSSARG